ncbi:MAG: hypothetical protein CEE40_06080 [Chloroflexi bacterium B3_Chlor]|nr:MAG: hypothetical protein CEE40_06080 [Chloroflexi bacterium B3_Chlor]
MTIRHVIFIALLGATASFFGGALLNVRNGIRGIFLPMFLVLLSILLAHDAYGNRLLPAPNTLAQIAGYLEAAWCLCLAAVLLWKHMWS